MAGPEFYGEITLILILANYFALPMGGSWGIAYVQQVASSTSDDPRRQQSLSALLIITIVSMILVSLLILSLNSPLSQLLEVPHYSVRYAILLAIGYSIWLMAKQIFQAEQNWKPYVSIELAWATLIVLMLIVMQWQGWTTIKTVVLIFFFAYLIAGLAVVPRCLKATFSDWPKQALSRITRHGYLLLLNALVATLAFGLDRIIIHKSLGASEVGIYQAHFLATYGVISTFTAMLINYLLPLFSQDVNNQWKDRINRFIYWSYPIVFLFSLLSGWVIVSLFAYPISWPLIVVFSLFNATQFHGQIIGWKLVSQGSKGTRSVLYAQIVFLLVNLAILIGTIQPLKALSGGLALFGGAVVYLYTIHYLSTRASATQ